MAYTKTKKTFKKRAYKRPAFKKRANMPLRNLVNVGLGFPKMMMVKQKYNDTITLNSNLGVMTNHVFSLNGLFDPNITATGHQPMYFDQYMAIYNHYTVLGCKVKVTFLPYGSNTVPIRVALWQDDDGTVFNTSFEFLSEASKVKTTLLNQGGAKASVLTLNWSAKKTFGPAVLMNSVLRGNAAANPAEQSYGVISVKTADNITTCTVSCMVEIEYITVYNELRDIQGS